MNGFEFLSHLEKNHSWNGSPEIYVCSNSRNEQDRKQAMKYPFVSAFIEKPLSADFIELLITDEQL
jgi:CheY-like chemotaxis protein